MENRYIDLHTHSTCSDGTLTPVELAHLAYEEGLCAVALTDHDTKKGASQFVKECEKLGIMGIEGVELSAEYKKELHIVSLFASGEEFDSTVLRLQNGRGDRNLKMLELLRNEGFDITVDDIAAMNKEVTPKSFGRPHMARALVQKGYVKDFQEAFDKYLAQGKRCYLDRFRLSPKECIELIKHSGGIAVWAHPVYTVENEDELLNTVIQLKEYGLDAIECRYSRYTQEQTDMCMRVAKKAGVLMSGGSDFHGEHKPDVKLGRVFGGRVPYEYLEKMMERL